VFTITRIGVQINQNTHFDSGFDDFEVGTLVLSAVNECETGYVLLHLGLCTYTRWWEPMLSVSSKFMGVGFQITNPNYVVWANVVLSSKDRS
jgi:hypothetical protein